MRKSLLALTLLSLTASSGAFAQQPQPSRSGTAEEQKFCRPVIDQGDFTILACLKEHRSKISAACDQVLKNNGQ
jgi:hypothetical protein